VATPVERAPLIIRPSSGWKGLALGELWQQRELLLVFAWRNILVRYKQTAFGIAWAILQPFFLMIVFTLFFNRLGNASSNGIPYPIFSYAGLLPWTFFSTSVTQSSLSLVSNSNLLRKIYFPRLIIPISTVLTSLVDFAVASSLLAGLMLYYGVYPEPLRLLALPALLLLAVATALGVGLWLSSLNVLYRDVQYVVPFLVQAWLFATPAVYVSKTFDEPWGTLLGLNPMQGVVSGFRWALLSSGSPPGPTLAVSAAVALVVLVGGTFFFRRLERTFADAV
jgi:lipopolysaccharide transport system permease protein